MKNTMILENYGVSALTTREMRTTNGGIIFMFGLAVTIALGVAVGAIAYKLNQMAK